MIRGASAGRAALVERDAEVRVLGDGPTSVRAPLAGMFGSAPWPRDLLALLPELGA
jgi:hypothetical protein